MGKLLLGVVYVWMFLLWILSGLMHIWTIYIAYENSGVFWGIVNLFFPVVSEIVWGYRAWITYGFDSPYLQWLIVLVIMWVVYYVFSFIITLFNKEEG